MNTCWFFGDSFTRGEGCNKGERYYELTYKEGCKRWTEIVSEYLGCVEKNCGWGGNSNQHILHELICNINNFKENDWVIVGDTRAHRIVRFEEDGSVLNVINDLDVNYQRNGNIASLNFIMDEIVPNEKYHLEYYQKMFASLLDFLKSKNINTLYWKHTDYWYPLHKMESITQATKGNIRDGHYSWKSHKTKANLIISKISNTIKLI